jgi:hypothetical protein
MRAMVKWAVMLVLLNTAHLLVGHVFGFHSERISHGAWYFPLAYMSVIACVSLAVVARRRDHGANHTYGRSVIAGASVAAIAAAPMAVLAYAHFSWLAPGFADHLVSHIKTQEAARLLSTDELQRVEAALRSVYSPVGLALATPVVYSLLGLLTALVAAGIPVRPVSPPQRRIT